MATERRPATPAEAKAVANPLRMRILRLCREAEWTNQELARRLDRDPSTTLRHVRILVDAGFLEPGAPRAGASGAFERPYRTTDLSWGLSIGGAPQARRVGHAVLDAFAQELAEAGADGEVEWSRFSLHLSDQDREAFLDAVQAVLDPWVASDGERQAAGHPAWGGILALHPLRDTRPEDPGPSTG